MKVHLVDGTFELFRCFHGAPRATAGGREVGAVRGLLATLVALLSEPDVSHVAVAFDSVVTPPAARDKGTADALISAQVGWAADAVRALNVPVWPSGRYQADEVLATAAARYRDDPAVDQVVLCSIDNDFAQCVRGTKVVLLDRIRRRVIDEDAVRARFGVDPEQIPELFALVGDRSDGLPGVPGWGLKSAAALLGRYRRVEDIPLDPAAWDVPVRGALGLAAALAARRDEALLCRDLSVLRTDLPLRASVGDLAWPGASRTALTTITTTIDDDAVVDRIPRWRD